MWKISQWDQTKMGSGNKKNWSENAKIKFQLQKENNAMRNIIKNDKHKWQT